jgi:hypothetical protein
MVLLTLVIAAAGGGRTVVPASAAGTACSDGIDNDGDGLIDLADPGCETADDNDELDPTPTPDPVVTPDPTTTPDPVVTPDPVPTPDPIVTPDPVVTPTPDPTAVPKPPHKLPGGDTEDTPAPVGTAFTIPPSASPVPAATPVPDGARGGSASDRLAAPIMVVRFTGILTQRGARIRLLVVQAPRGASVSVRCHGGSCPVRQLRRVLTGATLRVRELERSLNAGSVVEVRIRVAGSLGKYTRFQIRRGKLPIRRDACLRPGSTRPASC